MLVKKPTRGKSSTSWKLALACENTNNRKKTPSKGIEDNFRQKLERKAKGRISCGSDWV